MRLSSAMLLALAAAAMFVALFCQNITLASGDYRVVLLIALCGSIFADVCCAIVFFRGGLLRWLAVLIALPTLFVVVDFLWRAPFVWR